MASHASIIGYGARTTLLAIVLKFAAGPALMAASSVVVGLKGTLLRVAILQAALPQGIVPFVFAQEYNVHPKILSKGAGGQAWVWMVEKFGQSESYQDQGKSSHT
ncbi:hypothetical protein Nepgr_021142 [Nepenthes gracilis]|uniref:Uncharacterized protein n=1 Tax=Nepenthes gracilis TaxID=150966 RepID=A0AAD3SYJ9_NEPGR|nr:hypothetical protein Nepgr_021142 [Nepenthes gracilis]